MVRNLRLTQAIDTEYECPPLDSSFSGGESTTPSPSSSFSHHGTPLVSTAAWSQALSSGSPVSSPHLGVPSSAKHESMMPHLDVLMPQANYACTNILDGMALLGDGSDLIDCQQILLEHGLPAVGMDLDGTDYRLTPYDYPFEAHVPLGLDMGSLPGNLPTPECTPYVSQQIFDGVSAPPGCPRRLEADPYLPGSMEILPQTVVPSQTITEPMTPRPGLGRSLRSPLKAEDSSIPMESLMEYEALMTPTPDQSPVSTGNACMSALRWHERMAEAGRTPSGRPRSSRTAKRGSAAIIKTLDERIPLIVESKEQHQCTHADCNKPGKKKKNFGRREHLKRHEKSVHSGERPFCCEHCKATFSRSDNFHNHEDTHARPDRKNGRNKFYNEAYLEKQRRLQTKRLRQRRPKLSED